MAFRILGLEAAQFDQLIGQDDNVLARYGAERHDVNESNSSPCRIALDDAQVGETVILLSFEHQHAATPYRQSGPIFISEVPSKRWDEVDKVPPALLRRTLSVRGYDAAGNIVVADITEGSQLDEMLEQFFDMPSVLDVHIHFARRGCFAARAVRA